jgi:hypothetical protein
MTPKEFFDQFIEAEPDYWAEGIQERARKMSVRPQWCWRHWAPCPVFHANGMLAILLMMSMFATDLAIQNEDVPTVEELDAKVDAASPVRSETTSCIGSGETVRLPDSGLVEHHRLTNSRKFPLRCLLHSLWILCYYRYIRRMNQLVLPRELKCNGA